MLLPTHAAVVVIIAGCGAICIIALIAVVAFRLFASARTADNHLASGVALTPHVAAAMAARNTAEPGAAGLTPASDGPSQQIFTQLNEYYAANISQGKTIFYASLLAMCIGFAIVFIGVIAAGANGVTAIVTAIAGVVSEFIGATFLVALRSTQQQSTTYAQTLVELHLRDLAGEADRRTVALGLRLLSEISADRSDPANATKAAIAMGLIVKGVPAVVEPPVIEPPAVTVDVPPKRDDALVERRTRGATVTFDAGEPAQPR